jgi:hypothetical protein
MDKIGTGFLAAGLFIIGPGRSGGPNQLSAEMLADKGFTYFRRYLIISTAQSSNRSDKLLLILPSALEFIYRQL